MDAPLGHQDLTDPEEILVQWMDKVEVAAWEPPAVQLVVELVEPVEVEVVGMVAWPTAVAAA